MTARLVVSLSEIDIDTIDHCAWFVARLDELGVPLSLLVGPRAARVPARWLRERTARSDALVLHGYNHAPGSGWSRRAEFAALPAHEAGLCLLAALRQLERLRLATTLFAPPRWFGSTGTLAALRRNGFTAYAGLTCVRNLGTGAVYSGRVLGIRTDPLLGRAVVRGAARAARRGGLVRLAVSAADLATDLQAGRIALDAVRAALSQGAHPSTYANVGRPTSTLHPKAA